MASWRPPKREPEALRAALHDYLRNRAPKVFLDGGSSMRPLGRADMVMSTGHTLRVELSITPSELQTFGTRDAIVFEVAGHAAEAATGYEVAGRIVLDRETLAFLSIEVKPAIVNMRR